MRRAVRPSVAHPRVQRPDDRPSAADGSPGSMIAEHVEERLDLVVGLGRLADDQGGREGLGHDQADGAFPLGLRRAGRFPAALSRAPAGRPWAGGSWARAGASGPAGTASAATIRRGVRVMGATPGGVRHRSDADASVLGIRGIESGIVSDPASEPDAAEVLVLPGLRTPCRLTRRPLATGELSAFFFHL